MIVDISDIHAEVSDELSAVVNWCNDVYRDTFAEYFKDAEVLFARLQSKSHPITDEELSWILIDLPITLFNVSEALNRFRVQHETVKLKSKQAAAEIADKGVSELDPLELQLLSNAYKSVIQQVEGRISWSRELVMGAKKIWDARRRTEAANPVCEVGIDSLPPYGEVSPSYVKGR